MSAYFSVYIDSEFVDDDEGFRVIKGKKAARRRKQKTCQPASATAPDISCSSPHIITSAADIEKILISFQKCKQSLLESNYLKQVLDTLSRLEIIDSTANRPLLQPAISSNDNQDKPIDKALAKSFQHLSTKEQGVIADCGETGQQTKVSPPVKESPSDCSNNKETDATDVKEIVCYGIGNFLEDHSARCQLQLFLIFKERLQLSSSSTYIYDPMLTSLEKHVLEHLDCQLIKHNEEGKRRVHERTLFYLPHCGKALYNNLLWANWRPQCLSQLVIVGNSFHQICDSTPDRILKSEAAYTMKILPHLTEIPLKNTFEQTDTFNNTSVHVFTAEHVNSLPPEFWQAGTPPIYAEDVEIIRAQT